MIKDYDTFITHLRRTGRLKLLPEVLRELKADVAQSKKLVPRTETAKEHPALIRGWREIKGGLLTDRSGKGALVEIYRKVTS